MSGQRRTRRFRDSVRVIARVSDLERATQENRELHARLEELTDILAELLVPAAERDHERLNALLEQHRSASARP